MLSPFLCCVCVFLVPDAPKFFRISRRGFDTIHLQWDKPLEPNGLLIGYQLKYQTGELLTLITTTQLNWDKDRKHFITGLIFFFGL